MNKTIDIQGIGNGIPLDQKTLKDIGKQLVNDLKTVGFAYLVNTGISKDTKERLNNSMKTFFDLDEESKMKYQRSMDSFHGYYYERKSRADGLILHREIFDIQGPHEPIPTELHVESCLQELETFLKRCLELIEIGLNCKKGSLTNKHKHWMGRESYSSLRIMKYHEIEEPCNNDKVRLKAHVDFGTITIQFSVDINGLQILQRNGEWHNTIIRPDQVLLFPGPILELMTFGTIKAALHRVVVPEDPELRTVPRHAIILFANVDNDSIIEPLEEIKKINGKSYFKQQATKAYNIVKV